MKKILLIGGAGYVGTVVTSFFLKKGYKVNVLDNFIYNNQFAVVPFLGDENYHFFPGDINDTESLNVASSGITDVIILAGLVGDPVTKKYPKESYLINEKGIRNCIDFFNGRGLDKLIFISTCSNYGMIKENEMADEMHELQPLSLYSKAKVANEKYLMSLSGKVDYTGVILRFATAFGLSPRMRFDLSISEFVRDLFFGKELQVYDENTWRPYCHVRDFAQLLDIVINTDKQKVYFQVFNAGGDQNNFTKKMIVDVILTKIPEGNVQYRTNGSDARNYRVSFQKVKDTLGFEPKYSVPFGIEELINSFQFKMFSDCLTDPVKYGNFIIH